MNKKIAVLGVGNMGGAIVKGLESYGYTNIAKSAYPGENVPAVTGAEIVILAVKPWIVPDVAAEIKGVLSQDAILVSVCAGKTIDYLIKQFDHKKVIRVMPNTPASVGEGMSVIFPSCDVNCGEIEAVKSIFGAIGKVAVMDESLIDAVIGVSGSGPAYVFMFIDGMIKSGMKQGLDYEVAKLLATQTVIGAGKMAMESELSADTLKKNVCSPNGTTIEAVKVFEEEDLLGTVDRAMTACVERSKEMAKEG